MGNEGWGRSGVGEMRGIVGDEGMVGDDEMGEMRGWGK